MQLTHTAKEPVAAEGNLYITLSVDRLTGVRELSEAEYQWAVAEQPRMQQMADRALGPDTVKIFVGQVMHHQWLTIDIKETTVISEKVRSYLGWLELFGLEAEVGA